MRKIRALGWTRKYRKEPLFVRDLKQFTAVAFVHLDDVVTTHDELSKDFAERYADLPRLRVCADSIVFEIT